MSSTCHPVLAVSNLMAVTGATTVFGTSFQPLGVKAFWRLRVGIGHPGQASKVSGWVLSKASKIEQGLIDLSIDESLSALPLLLDGEDVKAMSTFTAVTRRKKICKEPQHGHQMRHCRFT